MFQDIEPRVFRNEYTPKVPSGEDYIAFSRKGMLLMEEDGGGALTLPRCSQAAELFPEESKDPVYLFSVDGTSFFLAAREAPETGRFRYQSAFVFRELEPGWLAFAGATAAHLALWYDTHRYCGRCTTPTIHKKNERAVVCPHCGNTEYPKISPVVIVAITDGDRLLLTKYAAGYNRYALVAGFAEIGETLEGTVRREVMEEVGLRVKNIRYYKSQPWAFSCSLLSGFFCEVDGSTQVRVDQNELSDAVWFDRKDIPPGDSTLSLTWTMVEAFRSGGA
ncbi:NAD+ diphosphatase [Sporobacter termitidis DSM 10068]|uniref:NAD(+) diphosphatase n=1 Tax=Sporobacter termitidis DSM 10068 TaxID=1123282 RepID=A0A1M5YZZ9_9FIRM|nr:NAD(+) diphosphatase [Sporobacter termitidis]SHI17597.1 NAD+ diphosphatase [Sporobacter termitidis DSM 10068]